MSAAAARPGEVGVERCRTGQGGDRPPQFRRDPPYVVVADHASLGFHLIEPAQRGHAWLAEALLPLHERLARGAGLSR
nr:hypothetical protein [Planosporangium mesophilum]